MKKLLLFLSLTVFIFNSCTTTSTPGLPGPIGPQGPPGQDGGLVYAQAIEIIGDFNEDNGFSLFDEFGFEVFPADVPLIYILWESEDETEIWRPLPQSAFIQEGILNYNFDFTQVDYSIFLDGTIIDFAALDEAYLNDQVFRIVVVPAEFLETARISSKSYESISKTFNIKEEDFIKRDLR